MLTIIKISNRFDKYRYFQKKIDKNGGFQKKILPKWTFSKIWLKI